MVEIVFEDSAGGEQVEETAADLPGPAAVFHDHTHPLMGRAGWLRQEAALSRSIWRIIHFHPKEKQPCRI